MVVLAPARRWRAGEGGWSLVLILVAAAATLGCTDAAAVEAPLQFRITEGRILNAFYQQGPVSAHLLLSAGTQPRVLVAFPAGNSGVGLWFENSQSPVHWTLSKINGVSRSDASGRTLRGIVADATVDASLVVHDAVLSSVRVLRDYQILRTYPPEVRSSATVTGNTVEWARARLDGAPGYALSIALENGEARGGRDGAPLTLSASRAGEALRLRITALTGEPPLTPLGSARLLNANAENDPRSRQVLSFLSYEEKFLAGSWRFNTYFGRDTLMSLRLLMPVLQPEAIEGGLMAVLLRLAEDGEVAHEEDIGEFAVLRHRKQGEAASDAPIYDYKMIDDDFMLAPVAAAYLFDQPGGRARVKTFLAHRMANGELVGAALVRNFAFVTRSARAFAQQPAPANLISLKSGLNVGQWRDSEDGLAGGRYPFDVNAVFVPAATAAIAKFVRSGALTPYLTPEQRTALSGAGDMAGVWSRAAPGLFLTRISNTDARGKITDYAAQLGVSPTAALNSLPAGDLVVNAIALDAQYQPIPVVHSDGGFALLLQDPPAAEVEQLVGTMERPFPAGLLTEAGLLVANPVFADATRQRQLGSTAYHGTVTWSWQQALLAAGLDRQAARRDLPAATAKRLRAARQQLWAVIENTRELRASELWSWRYVDGRYQAAPFGQNTGDADESNAAQLWSTVYLAVRPPARVPAVDTAASLVASALALIDARECHGHFAAPIGALLVVGGCVDLEYVRGGREGCERRAAHILDLPGRAQLEARGL